VSEDSSNQATNPMELWRQWFETGTKVWSDMFAGARGNYADPFGLYQQWFNTLENARERMVESSRNSPMASFATMTNNPMLAALNPAAAAQGTASGQAPANAAPAQVHNLWEQWFEAISDSWEESAELGREAVELTPRWVEMLGQIWNNFLSADGYPTDPLQLVTRWYNATSGPFSEFAGEVIEREEILKITSRFLRNYATFYKVFRRDSERYLKGFQIPVRSDITRVASLVVGLEDKVDRLEEAFEDFEYGYAKPATAESLEGIEGRIERFEGMLERLEGNAADSATADSASSLENRLDEVEAKIDQILAALQNSPQNSDAQAAAPQETEEASQVEAAPQAEIIQQSNGSMVRATAAARRRAEELGVDLSRIEGTGANGQITVDDVRREGAS
jgi:hypothetical protein